MAEIKTPPKKAKKKGTPPAKHDPMVKNLEQTPTGELENLSFKVPPEFKKEYRLYAAERGVSMVKVLKESFELYRERHPAS